MHGLPSDFNDELFLGKELRQVRFAPHSVHFDFDEDLSISVESTYVLRKNDFETVRTERIPVVSSEVMVLAGRTVLAARALPGGTLALCFDDGTWLEMLDDSPNFECYRVASPTGGFVV